MPQHVDFLLVGGGPASATAADILRAEGARGTISIVSAENMPPYGRPPLSKQFLLDTQTRDQFFIFKEAEYKKQNIELVLGTQVLSVDPENQTAHTDRAGSFHYNQLLLATGSRPVVLDIPEGALPGIYYLRTFEQAAALKEASNSAKRAIVVGGNFIGLELASSLAQKGLAVTVVTRGEIILDRLQTPAISEFFTRYFQQRGVEILLGDTISEFYGEGHVEGVLTGSGQNLPCDLVALGVGAVPVTEFLKGSGITVDNGIVADQYLQTNKPHIFTAGDVANFFDPVFNIRWRFEHWDHAIKQGRLAAKNMLGIKQAYNECSYFFSDLFDLTFEYLGNIRDMDETIERGSLESKSYTLFYLKDHVLQGLFSIGRQPDEIKAAESMIRNHTNLKKLRLIYPMIASLFRIFPPGPS